MSTKVEKKRVISILLIVIIIVLIGIIICTLSCYEPELETPPEMYVINSDGERTELLLTSYNWTYKGKEKKFDLGIEDITKYEYALENTYFGNEKDFLQLNNLQFKTKPNIKTYSFTQSEYANNSITKKLDVSTYDVEPCSEHTLLISGSGTRYKQITLKSKTQGTATYIVKYASGNNLDVASLKGTKLPANIYKIAEFLQNEPGGSYLKDVTINKTTLELTYDYWLDERTTSDLSLVLLALLTDFDKIQFEFSHNKYKQEAWNSETQVTETKNFDTLEPLIYDRKEMEATYDLTPKQLREYIKSGV